MFRIESVTSPRCNLQFRSRNQIGNQISVITGPNGSGKTEILTTLANWYSNRDTLPDPGLTLVKAHGQRQHQGEAAPSRVIAQTFSPFSRFAAPKATHLTLTDIYTDAASNGDIYRPVGINRQSRQVGSTLAKRTLEQGIFRMTESPERARDLRYVLEALGFHDKIGLFYRCYPAGDKLFSAFGNGNLRRYLELAIPDFRQRPGNALERELIRTGLEPLYELLAASVNLVIGRMKGRTFDFTFDFYNGQASEDYAVMQALTLLRRLSLLRLENCYLSPVLGYKRIDLADASSGQQQMLCSLFGLLSELTSDSLVLIDEPELSLHPNWQMAFLSRLSAILEPFNGCHVVVATHSPLIVQSALLSGMEVAQLRPDHEASPADTLPQYGKHASVEGTLLDVFGTPVAESTYLANEVFNVVTEGESGDTTDREAALARLKRLQTLYSKTTTEGSRLNADDLDIIETAIKLVSEPDDEEDDLDVV